MEFKDSKTFENVTNAINTELIASTRYRLFSEKAISDGYNQIAKIYKEIADNEQKHAEVFIKLLYNDDLPNTLENLKLSSQEEKKKWSETYQEFAETADEEGYPSISKLFQKIAAIENHHEYLFRQFTQNIEDNTIFSKPSTMVWICMKCGCIWFAKDAPESCPVCGSKRAYFQVNSEVK